MIAPFVRSAKAVRPSIAMRLALSLLLLAGAEVTLRAQADMAKAGVDGQVVGLVATAPPTPTQLTDRAWTMLSGSPTDTMHVEQRTQTLAALGLLGGTLRSVKLIEEAMLDANLDVRTAAVLAAGQTRSAGVTNALRKMLDDKEPQVAYTAALALWKMGDKSGEDILMAVVDGERRASANLLNGTEHDISRDLHSPATLAKIGIMQVGGMFLGPFGYGITAYEYIKKNGGESSRAIAIEALSQEKTEPLKAEFVAATNDKDPGVRAAALKALDGYHDAAATKAIAAGLDDVKEPVRLTAAAAYLIVTGSAQASPGPNGRPAIAAAKRRR